MTNGETEKLWYPVQLAKHLGVTTGTLANWRSKGRGPAFVRAGRSIRYRPSDVRAWEIAHLFRATHVQITPPLLTPERGAQH